jgi:hypothetical protein
MCVMCYICVYALLCCAVPCRDVCVLYYVCVLCCAVPCRAMCVRVSGRKEVDGGSGSGSGVDLSAKRADYIPATQAYQVEEVMLDLLHVAAVALKM